jgi:hypothetical protein
MNGEIAQLAALTAHAKIALVLGSDVEPLTVASSSFRFVHGIRFEEKCGILGFTRMKSSRRRRSRGARIYATRASDRSRSK